MDTKDYNTAVEAHSDALFRYAVRHLRDREAAKDIVQECFLRLWMRLDQVDAAKVRSYLFTTAHHTMVDHVRRQKRSTRYAPWHDNALTTVQPEAGLRDSIDRGLDQLPACQRSLVLLRDLEGYSYAEMATMTGLSMDQVKVYLFRARNAMKQSLGELALVA
jgi:RNA polymerase sigma-70 factor (ECF subfamily)